MCGRIPDQIVVKYVKRKLFLFKLDSKVNGKYNCSSFKELWEVLYQMAPLQKGKSKNSPDSPVRVSR